MHRKQILAAAATVFALTGMTLVAAPAQAATPTSISNTSVSNTAASPSPTPCPLTPAQLSHARRITAYAERAGTAAATVLGRPRPTLSSQPVEITWNQLSLCQAALDDVEDKALKVDGALASLAMCYAAAAIDGRSCANYEGNLRAVAHDLEVALANLDNACPWIDIW
jgi:hypothetical protein